MNRVWKILLIAGLIVCCLGAVAFLMLPSLSRARDCSRATLRGFGGGELLYSNESVEWFPHHYYSPSYGSCVPARPMVRHHPGEELWIIQKPAAVQEITDEETPGCGQLCAKLPAEEKEVPLPLKHTDVAASIAGYIATVGVTQQYHNPYDAKIEAVYVFPLPQNAAVNEFLMTVGERRIRGIIREREEAEEIYREARRQGVTVLLPHINRSLREWKGHRDRIRVGFMEIRSLQAGSIDAVLNERKRGDFTSLADFLDRCDIPFADSRALIRAGCFDELGSSLSRPDLLLQLMEHQAPADACTQVSSGVLAGMEVQLSGPSTRLRTSSGDGHRPLLRPLTPRQLFDMEVESFGYPVSWHPLEPFQKALKGRMTPARDIPHHVGRTITLAGVCLTTKTVKTRAGEPMEFLTFEDQTSLFECVLFPTKYKLFNDLVRWERLFLIRGKVEEAWGVYTITIEKLASLRRVVEKGQKIPDIKSAMSF